MGGKDKKNRSASVSQGHVVRCMVTVSRSGSPGLSVRLMRRIFHLYPPGFCVLVYIRAWPCVCGWMCACVLNSAEQVVRYHPNTVARQMADRATCIPFRPPGQSPPSPHWSICTHTQYGTLTNTHIQICFGTYWTYLFLLRCGKRRMKQIRVTGTFQYFSTYVYCRDLENVASL